MGSALYKRRVRLLYVERWDSSLTFCVLPDCFVATLLAMTGEKSAQSIALRAHAE